MLDEKIYKQKHYKEHRERYRKLAKERYLRNREYLIAKSREQRKVYFSNYPWLKTLYSIRRRVKQSNFYSEHGIKNNLTPKQIKYLWFRDKAFNMGKPSIDRKNGFGDYNISNCRFIEYIDNLKRPRAWRKKENALKNLWGVQGKKSPNGYKYQKGHPYYSGRWKSCVAQSAAIG